MSSQFGKCLDIEWNQNQLLFADDNALVVESDEKLYQLVEEFG